MYYHDHDIINNILCHYNIMESAYRCAHNQGRCHIIHLPHS